MLCVPNFSAEENPGYDICVTSDLAGKRADRILATHWRCFSSDIVRRLFDDEAVGVFDSTGHTAVCFPSRRMRRGETLSVNRQIAEAMPTRCYQAVAKASSGVTVLWQDEHLLIVDKPAGIPVMPGPAQTNGSVIEGVMAMLPSVSFPRNDLQRRGLIHRLDIGTSGALLIAKTERSLKIFQQELKEHRIRRVYLAASKNPLPLERSTVRAWMRRHPSNRATFIASFDRDQDTKHVRQMNKTSAQTWRWSVSHVRRVQLDRHLPEVLSVWRLETGRTHQIRAHARLLKCPLWGDKAYGGDALATDHAFPMLHAAWLGFQHPITGVKIVLRAPFPAHWQTFLDPWKSSGTIDQCWQTIERIGDEAV